MRILILMLSMDLASSVNDSKKPKKKALVVANVFLLGFIFSNVCGFSSFSVCIPHTLTYSHQIHWCDELTLTSFVRSFIEMYAESSNKYAHHISNRTITRYGVEIRYFFFKSPAFLQSSSPPSASLSSYFFACTAINVFRRSVYLLSSSSSLTCVCVCVYSIHSFYIYDRTMSKLIFMLASSLSRVLSLVSICLHVAWNATKYERWPTTKASTHAFHVLVHEIQFFC